MGCESWTNNANWNQPSPWTISIESHVSCGKTKDNVKIIEKDEKFEKALESKKDKKIKILKMLSKGT